MSSPSTLPPQAIAKGEQCATKGEQRAAKGAKRKKKPQQKVSLFTHLFRIIIETIAQQKPRPTISTEPRWPPPIKSSVSTRFQETKTFASTTSECVFRLKAASFSFPFFQSHRILTSNICTHAPFLVLPSYIYHIHLLSPFPGVALFCQAVEGTASSEPAPKKVKKVKKKPHPKQTGEYGYLYSSKYGVSSNHSLKFPFQTFGQVVPKTSLW